MSFHWRIVTTPSRKTLPGFALALCLSALVAGMHTGLAQGQVAAEPDKLVLEHATTLTSMIENGQIVRKLQGEVRFRQGSGRMSCDEAIQYTREGRTLFRGHVRIVDGKKQLQAVQVNYFERYQIYEALDSVVYKSGPTTLFAHKLTYYRNDRKAVAQRNVRVIQSAERLQLTANHAEYYRDKKYIRVTENPVLVQFDSTGQQVMRVTGDLMESFDDGKRVKFSHNVKIWHGQTRAKCELAEYFADEHKIVLSKSPLAWHVRDELEGDSIALHLQDRKIKEIEAVGHATLISPGDSLAPPPQPDKLTGQKIRFFLAGDQVERIMAEGTATSIFNMIENGKFKGVNWVQGDRIILYVSNNLIQRARIESDPGSSRGRFVPPGFKLTEETATGQKSETNKSPKPVLQRRKQDRGG